MSVPTLKELGYGDEVATTPFRGGESVALERMQSVIERKGFVRHFEKPKTAPTSMKPSTTVLSPYLKFGCLSVSRFWHELYGVYDGAKNRSLPPVSLDGQLLWREFYYFVACNTQTMTRWKATRSVVKFHGKPTMSIFSRGKKAGLGFRG